MHYLPLPPQRTSLCSSVPRAPKKKSFQLPDSHKGKDLTVLPMSHGIDLWTCAIIEYLQYSLSDLRLFDVKLKNSSSCCA